MTDEVTGIENDGLLIDRRDRRSGYNAGLENDRRSIQPI